MFTKANKTNKKSKSTPLLIEINEEPIKIKKEPINECYTIIRAPYVGNEFIPSHIIPIIVQHFFPSGELMITYNENHFIYKIKAKELLVSSVKNWEYNRPPDMGRCPDIARYIYNSKKPIDTMIYLSFNNPNESFNILDGVHRLTALKLIQQENKNPIDLLEQQEPHEFGADNDAEHWLFNQYLSVNIRFNTPLGELIEVFKNLNKSQAVPDLYIRDTIKEKRELINSIANEWFVKYKRHFSSSSNPNIGNTNRNKFVELLDVLYDKYKIAESGNDKLRELLNNANLRISTAIPSKASIDARLRCKESGCYLFLYKNDKLIKLI